MAQPSHYLHNTEKVQQIFGHWVKVLHPNLRLTDLPCRVTNTTTRMGDLQVQLCLCGPQQSLHYLSY